MASSANEIYRFTHRGLSDLVSARVATRVLDSGLDRARLEPGTVDLEGMTKILLGPVLRDLQTILPRDGLKHNLREIVRALRKIERRKGRDAAREAAKKAGRHKETFIDAIPVGAPSDLDLAAAFPLSAGDLMGGAVVEAHPAASAVEAPTTGEAGVVERPVSQDPASQDPASQDPASQDPASHQVPFQAQDAGGAADEAVGLEDALFEDPSDEGPSDEDALDDATLELEDEAAVGDALFEDALIEDALIEDAISEEAVPEGAGEPVGEPTGTIEAGVETDGSAVEVFTAESVQGMQTGEAAATIDGDPRPLPEPDQPSEPAVTSSSAIAAADAAVVATGSRETPGAPVAAVAEDEDIDSADSADADTPSEDLERAVMTFAQLEHVQLVAAVLWNGQIAISRGSGPDLAALSRLGLSGLRLLGRSGNLRSYYLSHSQGQLFLFPLGRGTIIVVGSTELNLGGVFAALTALKEEL